jgi:hypothetical protein
MVVNGEIEHKGRMSMSKEIYERWCRDGADSLTLAQVGQALKFASDDPATARQIAHRVDIQRREREDEDFSRFVWGISSDSSGTFEEHWARRKEAEKEAKVQDELHREGIWRRAEFRSF